MNAPHVSDDLLQRHFDGELEPADQAEASSHLADCVDCNARLRSLARMQSLIRMAVEDSAPSADFDAMFSRIERETGASAASGAMPEAVTPGPSAAEKRARAKWFGPATVSAAGVLAVAAAVLLMIWRGESDHVGDTDRHTESAQLAALETRSEIVHVDFGVNTGTVFEIAYADGSSTPVVWINDEDLDE